MSARKTGVKWIAAAVAFLLLGGVGCQDEPTKADPGKERDAVTTRLEEKNKGSGKKAQPPSRSKHPEEDAGQTHPARAGAHARRTVP